MYLVELMLHACVLSRSVHTCALDNEHTLGAP
jgi:hypothetical protein